MSGSPSGRGVVALLADARGYRRLWAARTISLWGDTFNAVALVLLVLERTGSGLGVSGVVVAEIVPVLTLAPLAGVVVDRVPRVRVMVAADLARVVLAGLLLVAQHHVGAVYMVAFGLSAGTVFFNPAAASTLPDLVDEDELVAANSGIWTAAVLSQILLAPAAGLLVATLGFGPAFIVNAASYAASALVLRGVDAGRSHSAAARPRGLAGAQAGLRVVTEQRMLRALAAAQLLAALSAGATSALLVVLARDHYEAGSRGYGLLLGAIGIGAATGPWLVLRRVHNPRQPKLVFGAFGLRGLVDIVLASTRAFPVALGAVAVYGIGTSTGAVTFNALVQATAPEHARGRVFAAFDLLWQLGRLVSLLVGGVLADQLGIRAVYYLGALLLLLAATGGITLSRSPRPPADTDGPPLGSPREAGVNGS